MLVIFNFFLLGIIFAHSVSSLLSEIGTYINMQISVLLLMILVTFCVFIGKYFVKLLRKIKHPVAKKYVEMSTFIFASGIFNLIFNGRGASLNIFYLLPFALLLIAVRSPKVFNGVGPFSATNFLLLCLSQLIGLSFILKISKYFSLNILFSACILFLGVWWIRKIIFQDKVKVDYILGLIQPILLFLFFRNLSNQLLQIFPAMSKGFFITGVVLSLALLPVLHFLYKNSPGKWKKFINWIFVIWGFSFLIDIDTTLFSIAPQNLDWHFWYHIIPGLNKTYQLQKPFIDYIPVEGVVWQTYLSRFWFVYLNQNMAGYILLLASLALLSLILYIYFLKIVFNKVLEFKNEISILLAFVIAVTNISLIRFYGVHTYAWCFLERAPMLILGAILFLLYFLNQDRFVNNQRFKGKLFAFLLGGLHAFSLLFETSYGIGSLLALYSVVILAPRLLKNKIAIILGNAFTWLAYLFIFKIPFLDFFYYHPTGLLKLGSFYTNPKEQVQIFDVFFRDHILTTFFHWIPVLVFSFFIISLLFRSYKNKWFVVTLYLFSVTFALYISRGNILVDLPFFKPSFIAPDHVAMSLILFVPLAMCVIRLLLDASQSRLIEKRVKIILFITIIILSLTDGFYQYIYSTPNLGSAQFSQNRDYAWLIHGRKSTEEDHLAKYRVKPSVAEDSAKFRQARNFSWSLPTIIQYFYGERNKESVLSEPKPSPDYFVSYSDWEKASIGGQSLDLLRKDGSVK